MFEKILVPLDGSVLAETALPCAEELAAKLGSGMTLVYVAKSAREMREHMHMFYLQKMAEVAKGRAQKYAGLGKEKEIKVEWTILAGNPAEEITRYADRKNIGLIVMATHGQSGIRRWTVGSVAERVVRVAKQPVALIRAREALSDTRVRRRLKKVLVPLDESKESEVVLPYIEALSLPLKLEVVLFQVVALGYPVMNPEGYQFMPLSEKQLASEKGYAKDYLDGVAARLKEKGITASSEVGIGAAAEEIINFAGSVRADLVAMATHGRSGVGRWVLGSVAERVLRGGYTPLLLVRVPKAGQE